MAFKFTEEQLNTLDKSFVVELFLQLQEQNDKLSDEIQDLNKKLELLIEQVTLSNKNRFGRSSEKIDDILHGFICEYAEYWLQHQSFKRIEKPEDGGANND